MRKLEVRKPEQCWLWTAALTKAGYGVFRMRNKTVYAHRLTLQSINPVDPEGPQHACHSCDIPNCANPSHLWWGTALDNSRDSVDKGRAFMKLGNENPFAKLTDDKVLHIRRLSLEGATRKTLADMFNVSPYTIRSVVRLERWKHVA